MSRSTDHQRWDEDDVRVRPRRGKSRPRTKQRPAHTSSVAAMVVAVDRGRYTCTITEDQKTKQGKENQPLTVAAVTARELGRTRVVVGDQVLLTGELDSNGDQLARVVRVQERTSLLRRSADDNDPVERALVANCDQVVIVTATIDPLPRPRLIDRCLVAAFDAGLHPLLVITKTDLASADPLLQVYGPLELATFCVAAGAAPAKPDGEPAGLAALRTALAGQRSVCVGHSGVGKSTLVNALVPEAARATGRVNAVTGRGRHTSSSAVALPLPAWPELPAGGWIIDTPGVRSFGIAHVAPETIVHAFPELATLIATCPRGCTHSSDQPECALDQPGLDATTNLRIDSLRRLLAAKVEE